MKKQTKVLLSIAGVLAVVAIVLASSSSGLFQGRIFVKKSPAVLKVDSGAKVLEGSYDRLFSALSNGDRLTVKTDGFRNSVSFECADVLADVNIAPTFQKSFSCKSGNGENGYVFNYAMEGKNVADSISFKKIENNVVSNVNFGEVSVLVTPTSTLATITVNNGNVSAKKVNWDGSWDSMFPLKVTSIEDGGNRVRAFYCDYSQMVSSGVDYQCTRSSFVLLAGKAVSITPVFQYADASKAVYYYLKGDKQPSSKSTAGVFYLTK